MTTRYVDVDPRRHPAAAVVPVGPAALARRWKAPYPAFSASLARAKGHEIVHEIRTPFLHPAVLTKGFTKFGGSDRDTTKVP